jgi:hypothetical protein
MVVRVCEDIVKLL